MTNEAKRNDDAVEPLVRLDLTRAEIVVLKGAIQGWIEITARKRMWPWRRLGWVDAYIYSRSVYASAHDKLADALKPNASGQIPPASGGNLDRLVGAMP